MRKGSHQSEEAKKKISDKMKIINAGENNPMFGKVGELHHNYGKPMSEEQKLKLSKSHKGKPSSFKGKKHTEEAKRANAEAHMGKTPWNKGIETGSLDQEHKDNISNSIIEWWKNLPEDIKIARNRKISESKQGKLTYLRNPGKYYDCLNGEQIWLRSSFEVRVVQKLESLDIKWLYEPKSFDLGNHFYHPDFYLPEYNLWWEVKGWLQDQDRKKLIRFSEMYSEEKIKIVFSDDIEKFEAISDIIEIINIGKNISEI